MKPTGMMLTVAMVGVLATAGAAIAQQEDGPVEIELMTYPEIYAAIHEQGKTTVLVVNGGIEQRGPHAVLGGHSLTAKPQGVDTGPTETTTYARAHPRPIDAALVAVELHGVDLTERLPS
jgi:hypothetical protein